MPSCHRLALALLVACVASLAAQRDGPRISPFRGMRLAKEPAKGLEVQVTDDTWHRLEALHGIDAATLLQKSQELCGDQWWKRITEDLPAVLAAMGHDVGDTVDLRLRDLTTGKVIELAAVRMTEANRRRLWEANRAERAAPAPAPAPALAPATVTAADVRADFAELRRLLDERFAYRQRRAVDLDALIGAAVRRLGDAPVERAALAREVAAILRAFGDGHSRLAEPQVPAGAGFLPFLVQRARGGHVAMRADRKDLLDPERPFLEAIDGVPIERWLVVARARATQGSPAMVERDAERGLRDLAELRAELELPAAGAVRVTLRGPQGCADVTLEVARRRPVYGDWPKTETLRLAGDVGYLRLPAMASDAEFLDGLDVAMLSFQDTRALIIDVRGNGGGSRDALRRLFPYLLAPKAPPQVVNVAACRLPPDVTDRTRADGYLENRGLHPAAWPGWTEAQRAAIAAFAPRFRPEWTPPERDFSAWHYCVLDHADNPKAFAYGKPVVVLIDSGCFSATDVFVAALRTLPQVRLAGSTTSGGSGRAQGHRLARSGIALQVSTMASYRPDGKLFEGRGVDPDVKCEPAPGDLVGASDAVLAAALALLR